MWTVVKHNVFFLLNNEQKLLNFENKETDYFKANVQNDQLFSIHNANLCSRDLFTFNNISNTADLKAGVTLSIMYFGVVGGVLYTFFWHFPIKSNLQFPGSISSLVMNVCLTCYNSNKISSHKFHCYSGNYVEIFLILFNKLWNTWI